MTTPMFDTHAFVKRLTSSGFTPQQGEALADEQSRLIDERLATKEDLDGHRLATKQDLEELHRETQQSLEEHRRETKQDLDELRLATKKDIEGLEHGVEGLEQRLTSKIEAGLVANEARVDKLELKMDTKIADLKNVLTLRIGAAAAAIVATIAELIKLP